MRKASYSFVILLIIFITVMNDGCGKDSKTETMNDIDGNSYNTIRIGFQTWMAENLKTTRYNDGTSVIYLTNVGSYIPGYCYFLNDSAAYCNTYGALYNFLAVHEGNLCPTGWHIPTEAEWNILLDFLSDNVVAPPGGQMKEADTGHWRSPNTGATNSSGFTALPGGRRGNPGYENFHNLGAAGYWWCTYSKALILSYNSDNVRWWYDDNRAMLSVRCLKD